MHSPQPRVTAGSAVDLKSRNDAAIAVLAIAGIAAHLFLRFVFRVPTLAQFIPLYISLILGGVPLVFRLIRKILLREFGSDLLAGLSIVVAVLMGQYLVGAIVVLMLSGGTALENFATRRASSVLEALASRMPQTAHRKTGSGITDIEVAEIAVGDALVVFPHEICPVDGMVLEGQGRMNEAYLTGEPFEMSKTPGSEVLSGTVNGETALTIRAGKLAMDSRYAKIMQVMQETQQRRPRLRRLGDMLGAWYTPLAIALALVAWIVSGESHRFLAVLVIATPCPLLLAIPVAVIGAISLSARRSIIIKNPAVLEQIGQCTTLIFDKTGTLTYGRPSGHGNSLRFGQIRTRHPSDRGEFGAIFETPAGECDSRSRIARKYHARRSHRSQREAGGGFARDGRRAKGLDYRSRQSRRSGDRVASHCGRIGMPRLRRW